MFQTALEKREGGCLNEAKLCISFLNKNNFILKNQSILQHNVHWNEK
jgi:hypothetical protein